MIKEFLVAITMGLLLGFGLTGGYFAFNKSKNTTTSPNPTPTISDITDTGEITGSATPTTGDTQSTSSHQITIDSPINNSIVNTAKVTIKGSTSAKSTIIITTPVKIINSSADNAGNFSIEIDLESGANNITIDSINEADNQAQTKLLITYSTAKI